MRQVPSTQCCCLVLKLGLTLVTSWAGAHQAPLSLAFLHVLKLNRTYKKPKDRGALIEEKTNHCLLGINLNSHPITSQQS